MGFQKSFNKLFFLLFRSPSSERTVSVRGRDHGGERQASRAEVQGRNVGEVRKGNGNQSVCGLAD